MYRNNSQSDQGYLNFINATLLQKKLNKTELLKTQTITYALKLLC